MAAEIRKQLEIDALYASYIERQDADIRAYRRDEALRLPADLDYAAVSSSKNLPSPCLVRTNSDVRKTRTSVLSEPIVTLGGRR